VEAYIPPPIQPLIDAYLKALELLRAHFYGIYIYGSIALGAFEELESDIDIIALTQGEWTPIELKQLEALHARLIKDCQFGKRLEVLYVPFTDLGKSNREIAPYPTVHDRKFSPARHGDLNGVTWWILKHKSIRLDGPDRSALPFEYEWRDVLSTMRYNLDGYFARKAKRPYIYLQSASVEFAVTNLCRILTTIEEGEIISKSASLVRWRDRLPERWQRLIDEEWRIRHHLKQPSRYHNRLQRMYETVAFIGYVRERGGKALD
jgi:hypothetical protein